MPGHSSGEKAAGAAHRLSAGAGLFSRGAPAAPRVGPVPVYPCARARRGFVGLALRPLPSQPAGIPEEGYPLDSLAGAGPPVRPARYPLP
jgi:hypothetical protein